ncbi:uncharacterized protein [Rutidosis leptorrhynchoides]|uniref:uncharacterized protein n=1 Tax=Rutidosis leptorrhynchoides TaxID=125765 RepID=UPI003A99216E
MPPIKPEPIEIPPETIMDIQSEPPTETRPDFKSEPVDYSPDTSPSKRLKTLTPNSPSKGKSVIMEQEEMDKCGVCFLEQGMSVRGFIDCCEHYFCFVCIMEWAKVESRCPICKRRFSTIRRPLNYDLFLPERIVNVPVRNQVHYYNGNATIGPPDPYSQITCTVCSHSSDEELLLLCDLCDSAAHSYCVGLGATVPEGDWFCKDCTISKDEHAKVETDFASANNINNTDDNPIRFAQSDVSIHDIVRDSSIRIREPDPSPSVEESVSQSQPVTAQSNTQSNTRATVNRPNDRALQRRANVHARIRVLRENWDGFRVGSINFASKKNSDCTGSSDKGSSGNGSYDIDKAWKMMQIATRAIGKKSELKKSVMIGSKRPLHKDRFVKDSGPLRPNNGYLVGSKKYDDVGTSKNNDNKRKFQTFEKIKSTQGNNVTSNRNRVDRNVSSSRMIIESPEMRNNNGYNYSNNNCEKLFRKDCLRVQSNIAGSSDHSSSTSSSIVSGKCCSKKEVGPTFKENRSVKKDVTSDRNIREVKNAKTEIQSLVKLNLKLLSKDKKLEVNVFKEVARHATHSIMAACGLELPKARFRSFERLVCDHSRTDKSTLMPTSCRECFFVFVKDVVTTVVFDRMSSCQV